MSIEITITIWIIELFKRSIVEVGGWENILGLRWNIGLDNIISFKLNLGKIEADKGHGNICPNWFSAKASHPAVNVLKENRMNIFRINTNIPENRVG